MALADYIRPGMVISGRAAIRDLSDAGEDLRAQYWELHCERNGVDEALTDAEERQIVFPDVKNRQEAKNLMAKLRLRVRRWPENRTNTVYSRWAIITANRRQVRSLVYYNFTKMAEYLSIVVKKKRAIKEGMDKMDERNAPRITLTPKERRSEVTTMRARLKRGGGRRR